jgi:hypothetical protein
MDQRVLLRPTLPERFCSGVILQAGWGKAKMVIKIMLLEVMPVIRYNDSYLHSPWRSSPRY